MRTRIPWLKPRTLRATLLLAALGASLPVLAGTWGARREFREGAREISRERRELRREVGRELRYGGWDRCGQY